MIHVWLDTHQSAFKVWHAAEASWMWVDGWSQLKSSPEFASAGSDICLYLPTQSVLSLSNELSPNQIKQLGVSGQQFLFEELALSPVEQLRVRHLSAGTQQYFYALSRQDVEQWQQRVQLADFEVVAILPDFLLLPSPDPQLPNTLSLYHAKTASHKNIDSINDSNPVKLLNNESVLLRRSVAEGIAVAHPSMLNLLFEQQFADIEEIILLSQNQIEDDIQCEDLPVSDSSNPEHPNALFYNQLKQLCDEKGILLTPSHNKLIPVSQPIKHALNFVEANQNKLASTYLMLAMGVLLLAGMTHLVADGLQWYQYQKADKATVAATREQLNAWLPDTRYNPDLDLIEQIQPYLISNERAKSSPAAILSRISPALKQSQMVAKSLRWNESAITLVVQSESRSQIDSLQQILSSQGIDASLGAVTPANDGRVIGEIDVPLGTAAVQ